MVLQFRCEQASKQSFITLCLDSPSKHRKSEAQSTPSASNRAIVSLSISNFTLLDCSASIGEGSNTLEKRDSILVCAIAPSDKTDRQTIALFIMTNLTIYWTYNQTNDNDYHLQLKVYMEGQFGIKKAATAALNFICDCLII